MRDLQSHYLRWLLPVLCLQQGWLLQVAGRLCRLNLHVGSLHLHSMCLSRVRLCSVGMCLRCLRVRLCRLRGLHLAVHRVRGWCRLHGLNCVLLRVQLWTLRLAGLLPLQLQLLHRNVHRLGLHGLGGVPVHRLRLP